MKRAKASKSSAMQSCGSICVVYLVSVRVTVKVRARDRGRIDLRRVLVPLEPE